jgi:ribosome assembly protein RRB1
MPSDNRKHARDEHQQRNKSRRILSKEEEEAMIKHETRDTELRAAAEEMFKKKPRSAPKEEHDSGSDGSWDSVDESDDDDVDERFDEMDEEEIIVEDEEDDEAAGDDEEYQTLQAEVREEDISNAMKHVSFADDAEGEEEEDAQAKVWRGDQEEEGFTSNLQLDYTNKAYDSFFQLRTEYPCLSFDIIQDNEGSNRTKYPLTMYFVCGSQADERNKNQLYILKVSNICRTKHDVGSDDESEDDEFIGDAGADSDDEDNWQDEVNGGEPLVDVRTIKHHGTANRVRCSSNAKQLCAVWSDAGHVQVFSLQHDFAALADFANWSKEQAKQWNKKDGKTALRFCTPSSSHTTEGYGLDWSSVQSDVFASGDCAGDLFVWKPTEDGRWVNAASSTKGANTNSIEEVKWSPIQADVLIAGRAGGMVEVWDSRDMRRCQLTWRADAQDINVCDWNRAKQASHLLVTGADSGIVAIWDLRKAKAAEPTPIQNITWHKKRITSVEFSLLNESVLSVTSDDGQCTLWDLSLERDASEEKDVVGELFERKDLVQLPDQLMFQHQGLTHAKEAHWHNQVPGMVITTDYHGLHLFKPMNWRSLMK